MISDASAVGAGLEASVRVEDEEQPLREREVRLLVTPIDSNGDAIAADRAAELADAVPLAKPAEAAAAVGEVPSEPVRAGPRVELEGASSPAVEVVEPTPDDRYERPGAGGPRGRPAPAAPRVRSEHRPHATQGRQPIVERVVLPHDRRSNSTAFRPTLRQLGLGLLLVAFVIVGAVALGFVLGRWAAQPTAAAGTGAGAAPKSAPANGQSPARPTRPADTSLIDAL
jgi:hypothetical protein